MKLIIKYKDHFPYLLLVLLFFVCVFCNYYFGERIIESDMAAEMILANMLNEEGGLLTKNYFYGQELRVFSLNLLFKFGLSIFPNNWHLARVVGQSILIFITTLSSLFFFRQLGFGKRGVYLSCIMLLPIGTWYTYYCYFAGFYLIFIIPILVLVGLVFYSINTNEKYAYFLLFLVSILFGMNGLKPMLYVGAPLLSTAGIFVLFNLLSNKKKIEEIRESIEFKFAISSLLCVMGLGTGLIGYIILVKEYGIFHFGDQYLWRRLDLSELLQRFSNFLMHLGYPNNDEFGVKIDVASLKGVFGIFGVLNIIIFIFSLIRVCAEYNKLSDKDKIICILSTSSIFIAILVVTLLFKFPSGYYSLPTIVYAFVIIELEIKNEKLRANWMRNILSLIVFSSFALSSITSLTWFIQSHPQRSSEMNKIADYLVDNDINKIYATFWDSNILTELSNGKIETYTVKDINTLEIYECLQKKNHINHIKGEIYVLISLNEDVIKEFNSNNFEVIYIEDYAIVKVKNIEAYINQ